MRDIVFSKVIILGAGAIGSAFGAALSKHYDVTLIGRKPHIEAINSKGLNVTGDVSGVFRLKADTLVRNIPEESLIMLTTKTHDSEEAMRGIKSLLKKDTTILILQNGIGNEEIVRSAAGNQVSILRGVLKVSAEFSGPGKVRFWTGKTVIGQGERAQEIVNMFRECGLEADLSRDINRDVWSKLIVNCVVNPLTAVLRVRDGDIITDSLVDVRTEVVNECLAVAQAEGVTLPADLRERIDRSVAGYANFSSMYQDIIRGRQTEIDFLNGKIVEFGRRHGIPTPVNTTLAGLVKYSEGKNGVSRQDQA